MSEERVFLWARRITGLMYAVGMASGVALILMAVPAVDAETVTKKKPDAAMVEPAAPPPVATKTTTLARVVQYSPRDTVPLQARIYYATMIVLPEQEKIAECIIGDKDFWQMNASLNTAWVKPSKDKIRTNLHIKTLAGSSYSFFLNSDETQEPDFKVFIEPRDESMITAINRPPKLVEASVVDGLKKEIEEWRIDAAKYRKEKDEAVAAAKSAAAAQAPLQAKHEYRFIADAAPFHVRAMWHDDRFTYIQANPEETAALYEIRDDKPNLVEFDFKDGLYTVSKVLQNGYLQIGKKKTGFERTK